MSVLQPFVLSRARRQAILGFRWGGLRPAMLEVAQ
jgi:hypothetical protein